MTWSIIHYDELKPGDLFIVGAPKSIEGVLSKLALCIWINVRYVEAADPSKRTLIKIGYVDSTGRLDELDERHPSTAILVP